MNIRGGPCDTPLHCGGMDAERRSDVRLVYQSPTTMDEQIAKSGFVGQPKKKEWRVNAMTPSPSTSNTRYLP